MEKYVNVPQIKRVTNYGAVLIVPVGFELTYLF